MAPTKPAKQPSPFHLALAIAVAKSKPTNVTVREYITQIRKYLIQGAVEEDYGSVERYLDAASYWRGMWKVAQEEIDQLQTDLSSLQQGEAAQVPKSAGDVVVKDPQMLATANVEMGGRKRKKPPAKSDAMQHKKLKAGSVDATPEVVGGFILPEETNGSNPAVMRHLYSIHKWYQTTTPDSSALAYHIIEMASGTAQHISDAAVRIQERLSTAMSMSDRKVRAEQTASALSELTGSFKGIQRTTVRLFTSLFHGLKTLWSLGTDTSRRDHGAATYEMVSAVNTMLSAIENTCAADSRTDLTSDAGWNNKCSVGTGNKKLKAKSNSTSLVPQELTAVLLALLSGLTTTQMGPHTAFFEGYLYLLLERTAKKLFLLTFKHQPSGIIEEDIDAGDVSQKTQDDSLPKAAALEIQFLIQILEQAMTLAPDFLGSLNRSTSAATSTKSGRPGTGTRSNIKNIAHQRTSISVAAKEKLQHTFIRCMFGEFPRPDEESGNDEGAAEAPNQDFIDVLRKPVRICRVPPPKVNEDRDNNSWICEEMWRIIGWDILAREDGW